MIPQPTPTSFEPPDLGPIRALAPYRRYFAARDLTAEIRLLADQVERIADEAAVELARHLGVPAASEDLGLKPAVLTRRGAVPHKGAMDGNFYTRVDRALHQLRGVPAELRHRIQLTIHPLEWKPAKERCRFHNRAGVLRAVLALPGLAPEDVSMFHRALEHEQTRGQESDLPDQCICRRKVIRGQRPPRG